MKLYKEVDASKELPENDGFYFVIPDYDDGDFVWFDRERGFHRVLFWLKPTTLAEIIKERITEEGIMEILDFFNVGYINYDNKNQVAFVRKRIAKAIMDKLTKD